MSRRQVSLLNGYTVEPPNNGQYIGRGQSCKAVLMQKDKNWAAQCTASL